MIAAMFTRGMQLSMRRLHFAVALLAMFAGMWAAIDLHQHASGLHAPIVCQLCALEHAVSGGCAPAHAWTPEPALASVVAELPVARPLTAIRTSSALIRAPPFA